MPRNIEIKARCSDISCLENKVREIADSKTPQIIFQEDTFFNANQGRLKLRRFDDSDGKTATGELIAYERSDQTGPKLSNFSKTDISSNVTSLKETLTRSLGVMGVVRKQRRLYFVGQTRIHIDSVDNLGSFVEFEVVLNEEQSIEDGERIAQQLMTLLNIKDTDLLATAYVDMLQGKHV